MKKMLIIGILMSVMFLVGGSLQAMNVGYADIQQAIQSVKAGKNAKERVEKEVAKRKKVLDKMREEIVKMEADFKKQELVLSEESKQKKRAEYTQKVQALQESVAKNQQEMQQEEQKSLAPILDKMSDVLKKLSKEKGYDIVMMKGALLYADDARDLTNELIKAFDKEYKN